MNPPEWFDTETVALVKTVLKTALMSASVELKNCINAFDRSKADIAAILQIMD